MSYHPYEKDDLDRACTYILERAGIPRSNVEAMQEGLSRPALCKAAAEEAFRNAFPDSVSQPRACTQRSCSILRSALNDLNEHGQFIFS